MELVYITHHSLLHLHTLAPVLSWALVAGSVYGLIRLALDVNQLLDRRLEKRLPPAD